MLGNYGRKCKLLIISFDIIYPEIILTEKYSDNMKKYFLPKFFTVNTQLHLFGLCLALPIITTHVFITRWIHPAKLTQHNCPINRPHQIHQLHQRCLFCIVFQLPKGIMSYIL